MLACRILCQRKLTTEQVRLADALLLQFCRRTERLYGHHVVTPNMHMHCHLRACIEDLGPLRGFWCYAFQHYNGLLGDTPNNNHTIEAQLMHRFIVDNSVSSISLPTEFSEEFKPLFERHTKQVGSLGMTISQPWVEDFSVDYKSQLIWMDHRFLLNHRFSFLLFTDTLGIPSCI